VPDLATLPTAPNGSDSPSPELLVPYARARDAFLAQPDLARGTRRKYAETVDAIGREIEGITTAARMQAITASRWDVAAPATWNRHCATVRSFLAFCAREGLLSGEPTIWLRRRREHVDTTRALPLPALERLWSGRDVPLREKTLWRLLYETAARANEVLCLDVEDLDLPNKRARTLSKGGATEWLHFQSGAARLLPRLLEGRGCGPVFLASLRPSPARAPAAGDVCPITGRARLSYRRAEELFVRYSGGRTLHQLRHSAITHMAERNVSTPLLMAKSRHASLRSLERYARPGEAAVSALTASMDLDRRR
jgi:integrase